MDTITITIADLVELALIGRKKVEEDHKNGIVSWIGWLPSEDSIQAAGQRLRHGRGPTLELTPTVGA